MSIQRETTQSGKKRTIFRTAKHKPIVLRTNDRHPEKLKNEHNDCTVWSITNATKKSYTKVHEFCKNHGRKNRRGTNMGDLLYNLKELGFQHNRENVYSRFGKNITVKSYLLNHYNGENVIVKIRGHVFSVNNWVLTDYAYSTVMNCRIVGLFYIEKI